MVLNMSPKNFGVGIRVMTVWNMLNVTMIGSYFVVIGTIKNMVALVVPINS